MLTVRTVVTSILFIGISMSLGQNSEFLMGKQHEIDALVSKLQARSSKLTWRFSCQIVELPPPKDFVKARIESAERRRGAPLSSEEKLRIRESTLSKHCLRIDGTVSIYQSKDNIFMEISSKAPVLGYEKDPSKWLPTKALIIFGDNYCIVSDTSQVALVGKMPGSKAIYYPIPFGIESMYSFDTIDFVLLSGLSPFALYGSALQQWKSDGASYVLTAASNDSREKIHIFLKFSGSTLRSLEKRTERTRSLYMISDVHPSFENLPLRFTVDKHRPRREIRAEFHLQAIEFNSPVPSLPAGTHVNDYRLVSGSEQKSLVIGSEPFVHYIWTGQLPTEAELKQLAYQQGNLLPPETPQRRYSLWMFLPAIALFGLALLLYLRRKR